MDLMQNNFYPGRQKLPCLYMIKQETHVPRLANVIHTLDQKIEIGKLENKVKRGDRVAITAGSRGIKDYVMVVKHLVSKLKQYGAVPFISPAMGSHGGATGEGQKEVLKNLGMDEATVGAPVVSSVRTIEIGQTRDGIPVFIGKDFADADHIIVVNRIKPHTDFIGEIESGLMKIMVIGMAKPFGAMIAHRSITNHGFQESVKEIGEVILKKLPILIGIGLVENQYEETAYLEVIEPSDIIKEEKRLLRKAKHILGTIPIEHIDLLIIDEMGKEISGSGMDTKVLGRIMNMITPEPKKRKIKRIFVRDLTEASRGNAVGIGLADYTTERLISKIDKEVTRINSILGSCPEKGRIPIAFPNDKETILAGLSNAGVYRLKEGRLVWVKNTLELKYLKVSEPLLEEVRRNKKLKIVEGPFPFSFDPQGNLSLDSFPE